MTQSELKELLHYNPDSGVFTWLISPARNVKCGDIAGSLGHGYILIRAKWKLYRAHRLAFLYMTGSMPDQVDHINHVKDDNRWVNLRPASYKINTKNQSMYSTNTSGANGVHWNKARNKWQASIVVNLKRIHLGIFADINDAITARKEANTKYNFHQNHGAQ